jgi:ABC-type lipoprotein export system ATPase subunit
MQLLVALNQTRRITVVLVTHEADVAAYCSRVITFRDGRVERDHWKEARIS